MTASEPGPGDHTPPRGSARPGSRGSRERVKLGLAGATGAVAVVFGLVNLDQVKVDWIVTTTHNALIVVIAVSFVLGGLTGWAIARRRARG